VLSVAGDCEVGMSLAFLLTTLVVVATPGTGAVYTISAGLSRGSRASIVAAFGCTLGVLPHMVTAITGLAALLNASAGAFQTIKWLGVAYLLYLAWQTWRDSSELTVAGDSAAAPASARQVILTAVLINLLNPKLTIFFFAFLPQFVPASAHDGWLQMTWLSAVFMAVTFGVFALYGIFAATMRRQVLARPRVVTWMRRTFAATYVLLAGRLAITSST
jgi:threonine/homoserine/homoserine lactone efflux protein